MKIIYLVAFMLGGTIIGSLLGYYGKCTSGACPLTANPFRGALWGLFLGTLFGISFLSGNPGVNAAESKNVIIVTDTADFNARIANAPTAVDFFATWCPPCKALEPVYAKLADRYAGKIQFLKVDIDKHNKLAANYSVESIPCVVFFKDGKEITRITGLADEAKYVEALEKLLK